MIRMGEFAGDVPRGLADASLGELAAKGLDRAGSAAADATAGLAALAPAGETARLVLSELSWVARMLRFASRLGQARLEAGGDRPLAELSTTVRRDLARQLEPLLEELTPLWLARSRPGGLEDSRRPLERLRGHLAS